jgi:hypothetical protein
MNVRTITLHGLNDYRLKRLKIKCLKKIYNLQKSSQIMQDILTEGQKDNIHGKIDDYDRFYYRVIREMSLREFKKTHKEPDSKPTTPTRLEVIDGHGRRYVNMNCTFQFSYQDDGKTLKIFVK